MPKITEQEKGYFLDLFIQNGHLLDFSRTDFNAFTLKHIERALCNEDNISKGKALSAYINSAKEDDIITLFTELLKHYENNYKNNEFKKKHINDYDVCRSVIDRIQSTSAFVIKSSEELKEKFSSEYITKQIDLMLKMQTENPTEAIGKSKELIESCCKTILKEQNCSINKNVPISQLVREVIKILNISSDNTPIGTNESKIIYDILENLHGIATHVGKLRNDFGAGHGHDASYKGLYTRHAKLAVGSSITLVGYLWDTYQSKKDNILA